ncbi:MAG: N-6 DNA methylase [Bryobacteraceae bacterium]|nr:N-6 DNA methylase [Bryobacteraceae bacterium]
MSTPLDWLNEFGVVPSGVKAFFASKADLNAATANASQGHILRRAFELLKLDGVLCTDNAPLVYFKTVKRIDTAEIERLHRLFWNHGGAPILVVVAPHEVQIYSGLIRPQPAADNASLPIPALVQRLDRASLALREFLPSVESGEFFRRHERSFDPAQRVDRDLLNNLQNTRDKMTAMANARLDTRVLDALLCRLVFACYLFDRGVIGEAYLQAIGLRHATHLRDVLGLQPRTKAKQYLYALFAKLGRDFNGDLFSDNLEAEARSIASAHIGPLDDFFRATNVVTGQGSFWPYDFAAIPIEAISAIYERFLQGSERREGAFYTPRFLAELVLDIALASFPSLLQRRYLDPACGSGIFLVGLFNRMAEEWKQANPTAGNDRRARELKEILCASLHGVDINPTACRITAFSLYLAYLDQLSPRDIQDLKDKGHKLPRLVHYPEHSGTSKIEGNIWCQDFFEEKARYVDDADLVIGNPPWGSMALDDTSAAQWCAHQDHRYPVPDKQIAAAFVWKAAHHVAGSGKVCLVLPHGILFNHGATAVDFQRSLFQRHAMDQVLNLTDYQFFLFAEARHPAIVLSYRGAAPVNRQHPIEYWGPKSDWLVTRAEVIAITPEDRRTLTTAEVLDDLDGEDAPQIWKQWFWASARDRRLVDRLSLYSRLRDCVRQTREKNSPKRWLIAEGFQPLGQNDNPSKAKPLRLTSRLFIEATSRHLDLFLLPEDCSELPSKQFNARRTSNPLIFRAPHVIVAKGFTSIAYADFDVSFRHALRGICGPKEDRDLLIFLAAYLRSRVARYFSFQTSSNWGVSRQEVHVEELLRLPFPFPDQTQNPKRSVQIITEVARIVRSAATESGTLLVNRSQLVDVASESIENLINQYFDILPSEKTLIDDTIDVVIPSVRPTRKRLDVPTMVPSSATQRDEYIRRLCSTINEWCKASPFSVTGHSTASEQLGIGVAFLQKSKDGTPVPPLKDGDELLKALDRIRQLTSQKLNTFELIRGAKVFDGDRLYVIKPIAQRFWTQTAALNDADEVAGTILMQRPQRVAW